MCRFDTLLGFLNCCGAIDAAHVILPAGETSDDWYGRERNYSMLLQGIVVHEMRFLDIGGLTVPRLLNCSGFFELCQNGESSMSTFNAGLEAARLIAVRSFLQLMGSWRILGEFMWRPDKRKLQSIILVCYLLYNINNVASKLIPWEESRGKTLENTLSITIRNLF
ncbi:hypothetical protein Peur_014107 [Populus x canadensis]